MPRSLLIPCLLLVAGCGAADVAAGVEVVESQNIEPEAVAATPRPTESAIDGDTTESGFPSSGRFTEILAPVEVLSGASLPERPETVAVIGDSLTLSAEREILEALIPSGIELVVFDGVESRRMTRGSRAVPSASKAIGAVLEDAQPDLWVLALGTNDVGAQAGTEMFREDMAGLLDLLPADAPVIWVDLYIRDFEPYIVEANEAIRTELGRRSGVAAVVDWYAQASTPGIITDDGVHLTEDGRQLFADSIVNAIESTFAN